MMSKDKDDSERLEKMADEYMEDSYTDFSSGVRHLIKNAYKDGILAKANGSSKGLGESRPH